MVHGRYGVISADRRTRLAGLGAVIAVHVLLIAFVLSGLPKFVSVPRSPREMIILLMPKRIAAKPPEKSAPLQTPSPPSIHFPDNALQAVPTVAPSPPTALRIPLGRCAPENIGNLSPEEQSKCGRFGFSPPDKNNVVALRSHVKDPSMRAAELAARNTPARVDCTRTTSRVIANIAQDNGVMVDSACALGQLKRALGR